MASRFRIKDYVLPVTLAVVVFIAFLVVSLIVAQQRRLQFISPQAQDELEVNFCDEALADFAGEVLLAKDLGGGELLVVCLPSLEGVEDQSVDQVQIYEVSIRLVKNSESEILFRGESVAPMTLKEFGEKSLRLIKKIPDPFLKASPSKDPSFINLVELEINCEQGPCQVQYGDCLVSKDSLNADEEVEFLKNLLEAQSIDDFFLSDGLNKLYRNALGNNQEAIDLLLELPQIAELSGERLNRFDAVKEGFEQYQIFCKLESQQRLVLQGLSGVVADNDARSFYELAKNNPKDFSNVDSAVDGGVVRVSLNFEESDALKKVPVFPILANKVTLASYEKESDVAFTRLAKEVQKAASQNLKDCKNTSSGGDYEKFVKQDSLFSGDRFKKSFPQLAKTSLSVWGAEKWHKAKPKSLFFVTCYDFGLMQIEMTYEPQIAEAELCTFLNKPEQLEVLPKTVSAENAPSTYLDEFIVLPLDKKGRFFYLGSFNNTLSSVDIVWDDKDQKVVSFYADSGYSWGNHSIVPNRNISFVLRDKSYVLRMTNEVAVLYEFDGKTLKRTYLANRTAAEL
jgi:hypothetical protein